MANEEVSVYEAVVANEAVSAVDTFVISISPKIVKSESSSIEIYLSVSISIGPINKLLLLSLTVILVSKLLEVIN